MNSRQTVFYIVLYLTQRKFGGRTGKRKKDNHRSATSAIFLTSYVRVNCTLYWQPQVPLLTCSAEQACYRAYITSTDLRRDLAEIIGVYSPTITFLLEFCLPVLF